MSRYELEGLMDNFLRHFEENGTATVLEDEEGYTIEVIDSMGRQGHHDSLNEKIESVLYGYTSVRGGNYYNRGYEVFMSEDDWNIFTAIHTFEVTKNED